MTRPLALLVLLSLALTACARPEPRNPVPDAFVEIAQPVGFADVRLWGDANDPELLGRFLEKRSENLETLLATKERDGEPLEMTYLALSGGGQYGAFAAGALLAWTELGTRPMFDVVSGISTGSIIAPFAFLGPDYDPVLREIYTTFSTEDLLEKRGIAGVFSAASVASTAPLREKIAGYVTPEFLEAVAEESRKGRVLVVGTTNLDARRSVLWNMGAIAEAGGEDGLELFRDVILASAAIPVAFPPVRFQVEADGERFEELHVDGGATSQVTVMSPQVPVEQLDRLVGKRIDRSIYVIVNGAAQAQGEPVEPSALAIAGASIDAMWYAQMVGDLYRIHAIAERDDMDANYMWIPASFVAQPEEEFDNAFMNELFAVGQGVMRSDEPWSRFPPNYSAR